jgi:hypothetical protein
MRSAMSKRAKASQMATVLAKKFSIASGSSSTR